MPLKSRKEEAMSRLFSAVALIAMASILACGGNGGGGGFGSAQRMTVEEYASACANLEQRFPDNELDGTGEFGFFEDAISEIKSWNPPEELAQFHEQYVRAMDASFAALKDSGFLDLMDDIAEAEEEEDQERMMELFEQMAEMQDGMVEFEREMSALEDELEEVVQDISPETRQALDDAGCTILVYL